jgi:uncharacterized protein YpmB
MNKKLLIILILLLGIILFFLFYNSNQQDLLLGKWRSVDDSNYFMEINKDKIIDYYNGDIVSENYYSIDGSIIKITSQDKDFEYEILELSKDKLSLIYLSRGNILNYIKVFDTVSF